MKKKENKNCKFKAVDDYEWVAVPATKEELTEARNKAAKLVKNVDNIGMRSCWQCNAAHYHFLNGKWGDCVLRCFDCGKYYCDKIDITIYD